MTEKSVTINGDSHSQATQYNYIDVTRGLAILGVMGVHSFQEIKSLSLPVAWIFNCGQLGVQLFFIASALTLCLSAADRNEKSPRNFYIRRYFRIAPLYYVAILFYLMIGSLKIYLNIGEFGIPYQYTMIAVLSNVIFVHGLYPPGINSIVPGGWSIGAEMLFYFTFPIIYSRLMNVDSSKMMRLLLAVFLGVFAIEILLNAFSGLNPDNDHFIYFNIINQLPVFLIGIYAFRNITSFNLTWWKMLFGFSCAIASGLLLNTDLKTGFNRLFAPSLAGIFFLFLIYYFKTKNSSKMILFYVLKKIGELSYSIYIIHFFVINLLMVILDRNIFKFITNPEGRLLILFSLTILISFFISGWSKKIIENKFIGVGKNFLH